MVYVSVMYQTHSFCSRGLSRSFWIAKLGGMPWNQTRTM